jgi:hypothetical protein
VAELLARMLQYRQNQEDEEILQVLSPYREFAGQEKLK